MKQNAIRWVPTAYFGMGLPYIILSLVSVIMFADLGVDETRIAFWSSLLILPYSLKPLWSPLLELYFTKKAFVVAMQLICGAGFAAMAMLMHLPDSFTAMLCVMGLIAVCGATNDIATDGLYITALDSQTQSKYIGWQGAFYNLAKVLANGAMVYLAGVLLTYFSAAAMGNAAVYAWASILGILSVLTIALAVYHFFALPRGERAADTPENFSAAMSSTWQVFKDFFTKRYIWIYILFIVCYRLTEGVAVKMVPLFLKAQHSAGGMGLSNESVGTIYGTFGTIAFILGSIIGGYVIGHFGLRRLLVALVAIFNLPFAVYYLLAYSKTTSMLLITGGVVSEYFCYGFGFVGLTLFMMQQVAPGRHPMAHYAFASSIMNIGVMLPGMLSGWLFTQLGYERLFLLAVVLSIPAFVLAVWMPFAHSETQDKSEDIIKSEYEDSDSDTLAGETAGV